VSSLKYKKHCLLVVTSLISTLIYNKVTDIIPLNGERRSVANFANILRVAFVHSDNKSAKAQKRQLDCFCALLGSADIKAAQRMLMKLTPEANHSEIGLRV